MGFLIWLREGGDGTTAILLGTEPPDSSSLFRPLLRAAEGKPTDVGKIQSINAFETSLPGTLPKTLLMKTAVLGMTGHRAFGEKRGWSLG